MIADKVMTHQLQRDQFTKMLSSTKLASVFYEVWQLLFTNQSQNTRFVKSAVQSLLRALVKHAAVHKYNESKPISEMSKIVYAALTESLADFSAHLAKLRQTNTDE